MANSPSASRATSATQDELSAVHWHQGQVRDAELPPGQQRNPAPVQAQARLENAPQNLAAQPNVAGEQGQRPPRGLTVAAKFENALMGVCSDKAVVSELKEVLVELERRTGFKQLSGAALNEALEEFSILKGIDLTADTVIASFQGGTPLLARTLARITDNPMDPIPAPHAPLTRSSARVERNTLNNRVDNRNIVLTPSTLIASDIKVSTISNHPDRPDWRDMPSVLYTAPTETAPTDPEGRLKFKTSFGNVLSFASNDGFTDDFKQKMNSGDYSHAELLNEFSAQPVITENLKAASPFNTLPEPLSALKDQIASYHERQVQLQQAGQSSWLYPDGSLPHNEFVARLWIWDATAVDVSGDLGEGMNTSIELQIARSSLSMELDTLGTEHPMFNEFVNQQFSIADDRSPLTMSDTLARCEALTQEERAEILQALKNKLEDPISVCRYNPHEPSIARVAESEVTGAVVLQAIESVLVTRLGPPPSEPLG